MLRSKELQNDQILICVLINSFNAKNFIYHASFFSIFYAICAYLEICKTFFKDITSIMTVLSKFVSTQTILFSHMIFEYDPAILNTASIFDLF